MGNVGFVGGDASGNLFGGDAMGPTHKISNFKYNSSLDTNFHNHILIYTHTHTHQAK